MSVQDVKEIAHEYLVTNGFSVSGSDILNAFAVFLYLWVNTANQMYQVLLILSTVHDGS